MRILLIRHGDPDYANDTVTEKGRREVLLLRDRLQNEKIDKIYCSPLGRACDTAAPTAKALGLKMEVLDWLQELHASVEIDGERVSPWDIPPLYWQENPQLTDAKAWMDFPIYDGCHLREKIEKVHHALDALLLQHGFRHKGHIFEILPGYETSNETIALFCHMGLGNVVLSHLAGIATPIWWHTMFLPPTSVTTVYMERHRTDLPVALAHFAGIGDTSHLYAGGEPISSSGLKNCKAAFFPPETL
ncbi:MAG: histidine phosphatase family protein [Clostridia bacterium]|nr:histidine phosphatase family protein [Clostridia bacterium]